MYLLDIYQWPSSSLLLLLFIKSKNSAGRKLRAGSETDHIRRNGGSQGMRVFITLASHLCEYSFPMVKFKDRKGWTLKCASVDQMQCWESPCMLGGRPNGCNLLRQQFDRMHQEPPNVHSAYYFIAAWKKITQNPGLKHAFYMLTDSVDGNWTGCMGDAFHNLQHLGC